MFKSIVAIAGFSLVVSGITLGQSTASNQSSAVHSNIQQPRLVGHSVPAQPAYHYTPPAVVSPVLPLVRQPQNVRTPCRTADGAHCAYAAL
jgi:hypothetical protein